MVHTMLMSTPTYDVIVPSGKKKLSTLTYRGTRGFTLKTGALVRVPLGTRFVNGIVHSTGTNNTKALKPIKTVLTDQALFPPFFMPLARLIAARWFTNFSTALVRCAPGALWTLKRPIPDLPPLPAPAPTAQPLLIINGSLKRRWEHYATLLKSTWANKRILVLLANQELVREFCRFVDQVGIVAWEGRKVATAQGSWRAARRGEFRVLVGTRGALFCPYPVDLIICDNPHHLGFTSERAPRLQILPATLVRGRVEKSAVIIGSGMLPYGTAGQTLKHVNLDRFPPATIIELKKPPLEISTLSHIRTALKTKEKVVIYHNRNGKSLHEVCLRCSAIRPASHAPCGQCGGANFKKIGFSVEGLARLLTTELEHKSVIVAGTQSHWPLSAPLVVGTRALFEHRFPETYVAVMIDPDPLLTSPRYTGIEELLEDFGELRGASHIYIQTRYPDHAIFKQWGAWDRVRSTDFAHRKTLHLPPFGRVVECRSLANSPTTAVQALAKKAGLARLGVRAEHNSLFLRGTHQRVAQFLEQEKLPESVRWRIIPEPRGE